MNLREACKVHEFGIWFLLGLFEEPRWFWLDFQNMWGLICDKASFFQKVNQFWGRQGSFPWSKAFCQWPGKKTWLACQAPFCSLNATFFDGNLKPIQFAHQVAHPMGVCWFSWLSQPFDLWGMFSYCRPLCSGFACKRHPRFQASNYGSKLSTGRWHPLSQWVFQRPGFTAAAFSMKLHGPQPFTRLD